MTPDVERFLPLKPIAFQILLSLADGERHGYGMTQDIARRTSARMRVEPGNLYRFLRELLDDHLVEDAGTRGDDARRRYYRLTNLGRRVAAAETARLADLVAEARSKRWLRGKA
jgi:DNA-binding PadR family transcriptional regulator